MHTPKQTVLIESDLQCIQEPDCVSLRNSSCLLVLLQQAIAIIFWLEFKVYAPVIICRNTVIKFTLP